jgi:heavy metal sensor kinase
MKKVSIGFRLTLWYLMIFAVAQFLFGIGMWFVLRQHLYGMADDALKAQVEDLTNLMNAQKEKNRKVAKMQEEVSEAYDLEHSGDFLQVYDQEGNWIFRAPLLQKSQFAPVAPAAIKHRSFKNVWLEGNPYRFVTQRIDVYGRSYSVQTGVPITEVTATLGVFERYLIILAPLLLFAAATGGYWLSRKALSPVDAITRTARNINGGNLSARLENLRSGDELQRLSDVLNEMLERIESAFQRVSQFTADASHELRTPISLIRAEAEITLRSSEGEEEYREALRHILLEAERTSSLIEELLTLARADSGREKLNFEPLDLHELIEETVKDWRPLVKSRNLQFALSTTDGNLAALADSRTMQRLLAILLDNAIKYTPAPGAIELRLEARGHSALIAVCDTGIGIAQEDQGKIFERFYRVDKARSRELGGAGIGLSIADWIARQHGGSIAVHSSPGSGSNFEVAIPLCSSQQEGLGSRTTVAAM